ncbi:MAG: PEP-CTERM sorting domain-containing protein [Cyanobacteriota bacterium]|nr:PEP-CTERM sorting domain-containing protein [Cyanobacteriota bacterium]
MFDNSIARKSNNFLISGTAALVGTLMTVGLTAVPTNAATIMGFQGDYSPRNFTLNNINADGSVDPSNAPDSILLTGGNNGSGNFGQTSYITTAAATGTVMFDFSYNSFNVDGPSFDPFGIVLNGLFTQLTNNAGSDAQNGTFSFNVELGDTFGFAIQTVDNVFGSAQVEISNFKAPGASVPEPASFLSLVAVAGLGFTLKRKLGDRE